jgi:hypothetical protein
MSVVKSKQSVGKLVAVTKSRELAEYTLKICANEKTFPKRYRWCLTAKIVDSAMNINNGVNMANSVFVRDDADYLLRKQYQTRALAETYALLSMVDIAYRTYSLETARAEYWTRLIYDVQNIIRNWRKAEIEKHDKENIGQ